MVGGGGDKKRGEDTARFERGQIRGQIRGIESTFRTWLRDRTAEERTPGGNEELPFRNFLSHRRVSEFRGPANADARPANTAFRYFAGRAAGGRRSGTDAVRESLKVWTRFRR